MHNTAELGKKAQIEIRGRRFTTWMGRGGLHFIQRERENGARRCFNNFDDLLEFCDMLEDYLTGQDEIKAIRREQARKKAKRQRLVRRVKSLTIALMVNAVIFGGLLLAIAK